MKVITAGKQYLLMLKDGNFVLAHITEDKEFEVTPGATISKSYVKNVYDLDDVEEQTRPSNHVMWTQEYIQNNW